MFRRSTVRYGTTPAPETPYQKAGQIWDERIGSARVQAKNWRLACFAALAMSGGLAAGLVWQSAHGTITPWVVQVDRLGQAQAVAPATADYRPTDPQIAWFLAHFIDEVREIPADPIVLRQNWLDAYNYVTDKGALRLDDFARTNDPFKKIGKEQIAVDVSSVIRASDDSFRVEWVERHYADNALASTEHWSAILTIVIQTPKDAEQLKRSARCLRPCPQLVQGDRLMRTLSILLLTSSLSAPAPPGHRPRSNMTTSRRRPCCSEPPKPVQVVEVPRLLPLPGQLKPPGQSAGCSRDGQSTSARRAANNAARIQPTRAAYINAVPVYPFSDGALYQVYAAPGEITDIALEPGRAARGFRSSCRRRYRALDNR